MSEPDHVTDAGNFVVECRVDLSRGRLGRRRLHPNGEPPTPEPALPPRTSRLPLLLALAHRCEEQLRSDEVGDCAALAQNHGISRPRLAQVMALLLLAPDLQRAIVETGGRVEALSERKIRAIAAEPVWARQREMWAALLLK